MRKTHIAVTVLSLCFGLIAQVAGADDMTGTPGGGMDMHGAFGAYGMSREASGTSWQPEAAPMEGIMDMDGEWMTMLHGYA
ncbi:MAG TPA: hypothetical protein VLV87_03055, partial [Gammaproteobacteria bacterium]|nr:hypothetical protein [Gammaproteobacteria bacterium]